MRRKDIVGKNEFPPLLHLTYILQQVSDDLLVKETGVGLSQARIMSVLHGSIPRSQRSTAVRLSQNESNVSRQLAVMQKQGLVSLRRNKKDGRQKDVLLSAKGKKKYQQAEKILKQQQARLLKLMSGSEVKAFERAARSLDAQHRGG